MWQIRRNVIFSLCFCLLILSYLTIRSNPWNTCVLLRREELEVITLTLTSSACRAGGGCQIPQRCMKPWERSSCSRRSNTVNTPSVWCLTEPKVRWQWRDIFTHPTVPSKHTDYSDIKRSAAAGSMTAHWPNTQMGERETCVWEFAFHKSYECSAQI